MYLGQDLKLKTFDTVATMLPTTPMSVYLICNFHIFSSLCILVYILYQKLRNDSLSDPVPLRKRQYTHKKLYQACKLSGWFKNTPRPYLQKGQSLFGCHEDARYWCARLSFHYCLTRHANYIQAMIKLCVVVLFCPVYHFSTYTFSMVVRYSVLNW